MNVEHSIWLVMHWGIVSVSHRMKQSITSWLGIATDGYKQTGLGKRLAFTFRYGMFENTIKYILIERNKLRFGSFWKSIHFQTAALSLLAG